jgi:hypothetical protein
LRNAEDAQEDRGDHAGRRDGLGRFAAEHDVLAVPPVGQRACGQSGRELGHGHRAEHQPRFGRRAVGRQDQQRQGDGGAVEAEIRQQHAAPEQREIAIPGKRGPARARGCHAVS